MIAERITISEMDLAVFCKKHHIHRLALFGSVLREDFTDNSDVDVLVEFEPKATVGFFELIDAQMELSELIGRKVDLNTPGFLSERIRGRVLEQAQIIYENR